MFTAETVTIDRKQLGKRLKAARKKAGFRTAEEYVKAHLDPKQLQTYRSHEAGVRRVSLDVAAQYAANMGTTAQALIFGEESTSDKNAADTPAFTVHAGPAAEDLKDKMIDELRSQLAQAREREIWLQQQIDLLQSK